MREFFTNDFFIVIIGLSALLVIVSYLFIFKEKLFLGFKAGRMKNKIAQLKDHFIVCGFGRVGSQIAQELALEKAPFVVIDRDEERIKEINDKGWLCLGGDAAKDEELLKKAHIDRAKGLILAFGDDADNVYVAVSVKALNPNLFVVARASAEETADKLKKLGVERVARPYQIGGYHMATMALRPAVIDFLDVAVDSSREDLQVEEMRVAKSSKLIGQPIAEYLSRRKTGTVVLAVKKSDGSSIINPNSELVINQDDTLILLGTKTQLNRLAQEFK